jgi:hypothetical protein
MAELAVTDGRPPPDDLPRGECILTTMADGRVRIDQADPRILISAELLDAIVDGDCGPAWLDTAGCTTTYDDALLKIEGVNRTVIYRIVDYVPRVRGYVAEWPD